MGLKLAVQPKSTPAVQTAAPLPLETESDREWVDKIVSQRIDAYVNAEVRAMEAAAEASARVARLDRQRAWLADNATDPAYEERCQKHLAELRGWDEDRRAARRSIGDAVRLWADLPDRMRRTVDGAISHKGLGMLAPLTRSAALNPDVDPAWLIGRTEGRTGLAALCIDPMAGWS